MEYEPGKCCTLFGSRMWCFGAQGLYLHLHFTDLRFMRSLLRAMDITAHVVSTPMKIEDLRTALLAR